MFTFALFAVVGGDIVGGEVSSVLQDFHLIIEKKLDWPSTWVNVSYFFAQSESKKQWTSSTKYPPTIQFAGSPSLALPISEKAIDEVWNTKITDLQT